jgi:predicted DNA-binding transcriptional regulator AlpA
MNPLIKKNDNSIIPSDSAFFDKLITKKQLAEYFSMSERSIDRMMAKGTIPYKVFDRAVRFSVKEIMKWLQTRSRNHE